MRRPASRHIEGRNLAATLRRVSGRLGWGEFAVLAAFAICAGGLYAFVEIVDDTLEGDARRFDRMLLLALRNPADPSDPIGPAWLEIMFRDLTVLGSYTVIVAIGLLAAGYLAINGKRVSLIFVLVSVAGGALINSVLKEAFDRPRPDLVTHLVDVGTASLPSGHAMLSAVAYLTLGALLAAAQPQRWLKTYIISAAVALTLLIGFSRTYLGVHWPTDVLAGWSIGAAWAMGCWLAAQSIEKYRKVGAQDRPSS